MAVMIVVGRFEEHSWCFGLFGRSGANVVEQARASVARCFFGAKTVQLLKGDLCLVLEDDFVGSGIDTTIWSWDVAMDGFG